MEFEHINLEVSDGVALLSLNRPQSMNGLTSAMMEEMRAALAQLSVQDDIGALILTGSGKTFCSGADMGFLQKTATDAQGESPGDAISRSMRELANPLILDLRRAPFPVVSAVNGAAAGAGMGIALATDIVIAARSAYFLCSFLPTLGIVPDLGTSWFVPYRIGRARATAFALLGERLPAEQAKDWGLIWDCVEDDALLEEARRIARRLAAMPRHSALEARHLFEAAHRNELPAQLDYESERQRELLNLPSFREGVSAFLEKRPPVFNKRS